MPEGHTIARIARDHAALLRHDTLRVSSPQGRFEEGAKLLDGRALTAIRPHGKHLWYDAEGVLLHIHLGLYGKFTVGHQPTPPVRGLIRVRIETDEAWLDLRGPTACEIVTPAERDLVLARLGPDPLARKPDGTRAYERIARSKTSIGALLMDQKVLAGAGNIFRCEVLFRQGISPFRPGTELGPESFQLIWDDLVVLMRAGVKAGRIVTTRPVDRPRGRPTREQSFYVYKREGQPCRHCGTELRTAVMVGRNLFWCPTCQSA